MQTYIAATLGANSGRNQVESNYVACVAGTVGAHSNSGRSYGSAPIADNLIAHALTAEGFDASEDGTGRGTPLTVAFNARQDPDSWVERTGPLDTDGGTQAVSAGMGVRRLTPRECERLQGFPDDYTLVPFKRNPPKDDNRYKALGNSMAIPVMAWIGRRIAECSQAAKGVPGNG